MTDDHERPPESAEKAPLSAERVQGVAEQGMDWGKALAAAENRADRAEAERDAALAKVARAAELIEDFESDIDWSNGRSDYGDNAAYDSCAQRLRAALADEEGR